MLTSEQCTVPRLSEQTASSDWPLRIGIAATIVVLSFMLLKLSLDVVIRHPEIAEALAVVE